MNTGRWRMGPIGNLSLNRRNSDLVEMVIFPVNAKVNINIANSRWPPRPQLYCIVRRHPLRVNGQAEMPLDLSRRSTTTSAALSRRTAQRGLSGVGAVSVRDASQSATATIPVATAGPSQTGNREELNQNPELNQQPIPRGSCAPVDPKHFIFPEQDFRMAAYKGKSPSSRIIRRARYTPYPLKGRTTKRNTSAVQRARYRIHTD